MTIPSSRDREQLFDGLRNLRSSWPSRGWSWDSRFGCVASSITVAVESHARGAVKDVLSVEWTSKTIDEGPPELREIAQRTGGLRSGQYLFSGGHGTGLVAFGLWWPWQNTETISMRIGLLNLDERDPRWERLRTTFGVTF